MNDQLILFCIRMVTNSVPESSSELCASYKLSLQFNVGFCYRDDLFSLNNLKFGEIHQGHWIYYKGYHSHS